MHSLRGLLIALLGLFTGLDAAAATAEARIISWRDAIERGYNDRNSEAIEAAITALGQEPGLSAAERDAAVFYSAFGRLRQATLPGISSGRARDYLEQCLESLAPLVERRPDYAVARALHASCLGASAGRYLLRAATRGMAARREIAAAVAMAPDDPWVVFQDGVGDFMTPAMFGGDTERALGKLRRAAELFRASRPAGAPAFGESETWLYIGRVHLAAGRRDEARAALEQARLMSPGSADVREELARL